MSPEKKAEFHKKALDRFQAAYDHDDDNRRMGQEDARFVVGENQWDQVGRANREANNQPVLVLNHMPKFVRQVTGDIRRLNPAIKVVPGDNIADKAVAEVYEGLIRAIEYGSSASHVYEKTGESAAICGIGNFRVKTDYCDDETFDQEAKIEWIPNPFAVTWDPQAKLPTRADAMYCFVHEWITRDEYESRYPKQLVNDFPVPEENVYWYTSNMVRISEYIWVEEKDKDIYLLLDGTVTSERPKDGLYSKKRTAKVRTVKTCMLSGTDILEPPTVFPGKLLPVIAVSGEEVHDGERVVRSSVIRYAKDPQRMYNYWRSVQTEIIGAQPRAPYLMTPRQIQGHETLWATANVKNKPYLLYNPDKEVQGAPKRAAPPVASGAMAQEIASAEMDMKATTGIYDASLGNRSNEVSGIAISRRQEESDISTSIYADNMAQAVEQCGRVLVGIIPEIYDGERTVAIIGTDNEPALVEVNKMFLEGTDENGVNVYGTKNDLSHGKYAVRIKTGPSYTTRRQESAAGMIEFVKSVPKIGEIAADLIAEAQDWPQADRLAKRIKKTLPPELTDESPEGTQPGGEPAPPSPQQAMEQQAMQAQQMANEMEMAAKKAQADKEQFDAARAKALADAAAIKVEEAQLDLEIKKLQMRERQVALARAMSEPREAASGDRGTN